MDNNENIFEKISNFFGDIWGLFHIFDALGKQWDKLEPKVKNALIWGSGITDVITKNLNATPQFILDLIQQKFPNVDIEEVKAKINEVAAKIKTAGDIPGDDINSTLLNLQAYFAGLGDKEWEAEASTFAQKLAAVFAPDAKFATIVTFAEYVYRRFIKGEK